MKTSSSPRLFLYSFLFSLHLSSPHPSDTLFLQFPATLIRPTLPLLKENPLTTDNTQQRYCRWPYSRLESSNPFSTIFSLSELSLDLGEQQLGIAEPRLGPLTCQRPFPRHVYVSLGWFYVSYDALASQLNKVQIFAHQHQQIRVSMN